MKILNINHNDGDALGCQLVLEFEFGRENVKVERCTYNNVNGTLYNYLKSGEYKQYDKIYITDISISDKMANWVDSVEDIRERVVLIDHHKTAEHLNKYSWATVQPHDENGVAISACKLVANHFEVNNYVLLDIVRNMNDYDCWHWSTNGNIKAKNINDLLYMVGMDEMLDEFHSQLFNTKTYFELRPEYEFLLKIREREYKQYLESSNKNLTIGKYREYRVGICLAERFISELGNDLAKLNTDLDFIAILNMRSGLSLRGIKDDIDLGVVAKELGAIINTPSGGHSKSSGISLTTEYKLNFLSDLFEIEGRD